MEGIAYGESTRRVFAGDLLLLYTDGVTEAKDPEGRLFSDQRLADLLSARAFGSVEDAVKAAIEAVAAFESGVPQTDDVAILGVRFERQGSGKGRSSVKVVARNRVSEIRRVQQAFDRFAEEHRISAAARPRVELALEELLQNVIAHAFEDDREHTIEIEIEIGDGKIVVTLTDGGIPFDPLAGAEPDTSLCLERREPGGLGIHLVKKMAHELSYERRAHRNIVRLVHRVD
jgi:sigma-B regulation protein RsbU (phosphoserine phosphatase)